MKCNRCGEENSVYIMSMFNLEEICTSCKEKEKSHPDYPEAVRAEHQACLSGDFNFPGVGKPEDL